MEFLVAILILLILFFVIRGIVRLSLGYKIGNAYYNHTQIQYVDKGAYIRIGGEWYKMLHCTSRYAAITRIYLEHETTKELKEVVVSPEYWVEYKVYQTI